MPIGIHNGTALAYDLREVAAMLGHQDIGCEDGRAVLQHLADYFRQHNLIVLFNVGGGWDSVSRGAVRAYCIDHDLPIPDELSGMATTEETHALIRKMQRDVAIAQDAVLSKGTSSAVPSERKRGGSRPESDFVARYVTQGRELGRSTAALRHGITAHINVCITERDPDCPFTHFDVVRKVFTVIGAKGGTREVSVERLSKAVASACKKKL